jgi:4-amino-4-deoxy-L-arabinose transferase-like glycosyltransferase
MEAEAVPERTASSPDDGPPAILETDEPSEGRTLPILADDPTSLRTWEPPRHERRWRLFVFLGACLVFLPNLGGFGLWDPWETHYGAVSTEMLDTYDWVSPWWGYREKIGDKQQGSFFYSKPVFIFWTEAIASRVIGRGEWALRLPIALLAILSVFLAFIVLTKVWSRRVGLLGALIMATSPEFFMISRQAQTDMPFVATMLISLLLLIMAFFGPREPMSDKRFMRWTWLSVGFLLLNTLPQYGILITDINYGWVHALVYVLVLALLLWWFARDWRRDKKRSGLDDAFKDRWLRKYYLIAAFVFFAHSTYAKGLLGFMMPGAIILIWLVVTRTWAVLKRAELIRGTVTFAVVGFPWYAAMFVVHGKPYYDRFIIHDHFKRLGEGVHQIDSGTFEHFIKWLGVGTFPWVAFVPLALLWLIRLRARDANPKNQAKVFAAVWFMVAFAFFTASSTKFHHYIFPAFPALAIILALFIDRLLDEGAWLARLAAVTGVVVFFAVGWDIHEDHQHLRNLMTYKYDRPLAQQLPIDEDGKVSPTATTTWKDSLFFQEISPTLRSILTTKAFKYNTFIEFLLILGAIALALFFVAKTRMAGLVGLGLCASMLAVWSLNYYMPSLTPGWSQKYLFDSYYRTCNKLPLNQDVIDAYEPFTVTLGLDSVDERSPGAWTTGLFRGQYKTVCEEDVIGWLITWRGETYYSWNELKPIEKKEEQFGPYLRDFNGGKKFYILIERGKTASFKSELVSESNKLKKEGVKGWTDIRDWDVQVENDENLYFQMASATPLR